ncbi:spore coat protein [Desulforamulus ferrireducens]|uniref:Coat protein F n=1 Tax=Desulforamulus ferrireducens TaxID=1833852 RepID=A0A1S6IX26_9FIRM|nr:spore coat protein [Desulforamulus ferrireducens]AQS59315.1 coat protein F [Desulforamulus ferrireducens]
MYQDQVTDKNLCLALINQLKWSATCLTGKILECADDQLRQEYMQILNRTFAEQKRVFDFAHQQGWYQPMMAEQQMIGQVQSDTQKLMMEQQHSMGNMHQIAQQQSIQSQGMYNYQNQNHYGGQPYYSR